MTTEMTNYRLATLLLVFLLAFTITVSAQDNASSDEQTDSDLFRTLPPWLVDMPTAGTLGRGQYQIGMRLYPDGGALGFTDIGLSNRLQMGISFGGQKIISNQDPSFDPRIEFNIKFRPVDEMEFFPAITVGFCSQGFGPYDRDIKRYAFKSRGFYAVASRGFYFFQWTAGWHGGVNYSLENDVDKEDDLNVFIGMDATFKHNLALLFEYDFALNDDRGSIPNVGTNYFGGKGRGYLNMSVKWLFADNLQLEALLKDFFTNRREPATTFTREVRITYTGAF
jgi:hypothetical protein